MAAAAVLPFRYPISFAKLSTREVVVNLRAHLRRNDDFQRTGLRRTSESVVSVEDVVELEAVGDQPLRVDLMGLDGLQQHGRGYGIDKTRRDRDVLRPQALEVKIKLYPGCSDIGDRAAGCQISSQVMKDAGTPTASIAVSTPRPLVIFMTSQSCEPRNVG